MQRRYSRSTRSRREDKRRTHFLVAFLFLFLLLLTAFLLQARSYAKQKAQGKDLKEQKNIIQNLKGKLTDLKDLDVKLKKAEDDVKISNHDIAELEAKRVSVAHANNRKYAGRTIYLTFDDGPSDLTPRILDILDQYHVKATFFVMYNPDPQWQYLYDEIVKRGHEIAIHTTTHKYKEIYKNMEAFENDFDTIYNFVVEKTGVRPKYYRFPGGSNTGYNKSIRDAAKEFLKQRGMIFYDWNASNGDGIKRVTPQEAYDEAIRSTKIMKQPVVLMHDGAGHEATVEALPKILQTWTDMGYNFSVITDKTIPIQFRIHKKH